MEDKVDWQPLLSIVIPAYNEERRIEESLKKIFNYLRAQSYSYEVIISDDGSTDETLNIVKSYQSDWPELKILQNPHKGKAPAIISGVNHSKGQFVLFTDVDLSVSIDQLGKMLVWVKDNDYDLAIATREGPGAQRIGEPYSRHLMGRIFNSIVQLVVLKGINDTQCGFKMFKGEAAKEIFKRTKLYSVNDPEIKGAKVSGFDVELLYVARKLGYKIKEVPVVWIYSDNSKVHSLKDSYYNFVDVLRVRFNSLKGDYRK